MISMFTPRMLDVVALLRPLPEHNLPVGQVGTVVELWNGTTAEVEFADANGHTMALVAIPLTDLLVLHFHQAPARV